ncbi:hypothetical protein HUK80_01920 [Flavobacterium sp. MAH-1]|uniref:Uncharacterized protein n=1 Tax=Flavobacterium agri TaxID=2743471 RepID=A0A7Y9C5X8_9FLAO|nr:hypothetical protein [Flavobacterium agri]NUY79637.1 hypothetical protein [Flavobacterium agri]NYA69662.1 hypothetical protein [Flavobacterium agri]
MEHPKKKKAPDGSLPPITSQLRNDDDPPREDGPNTTKYLELEQADPTYTPQGHPTMNSDYFETVEEGRDEYDEDGDNSRNSEAFDQDEDLLIDNLDLDEEMNRSVSSDD